MTSEELLQQLKNIQNIKCETQTLELKSAEKGCRKGRKIFCCCGNTWY